NRSYLWTEFEGIRTGVASPPSTKPSLCTGEIHRMALSSLQRVSRKSRPPSRSTRRHSLALETLEGRTVLSFLPAVSFAVRVHPRAVTITASFSAGTLRVAGSEQDDTIVVSRDAAGTILVNGGSVAIQGGPATVASTSLILLNGGAGSD